VYSNIRYEIQGAIASITVARPAALNALDQATIGELHAAFQAAKEDRTVRGVILTGDGGRAFVAGADINELASISSVQADRFTAAGQALTTYIETLGKPVVAAIDGFALGGGCELAMACTVRVATPTSVFGQPEVKLGVIPGFGGTQRLPALVGTGRALQMILTGDPIGAEEAWRIGLVNELVEAGTLLSHCTDLLGRMVANAPLATRLATDAVLHGRDVPLGAGLRMEGALFAVCVASSDKAEGTAAFLARRKPVFTGA
jgi:enoyl-CoA hydratase